MNQPRQRHRSRPPAVPGKKVSFIQLMRWEGEFELSGRARVEQLGAAFCTDFEIKDDRLRNAGHTLARQIIFERYMVTDVRYHQNARTTAADDLAELYPVDQGTA